MIGVRLEFARELQEGEFVDFKVGVMRFGPLCCAFLSGHHVSKLRVVFLVGLPCNKEHGVINKSDFSSLGSCEGSMRSALSDP